jgi:glycosyltransferase involved in cell wall biosynthesis
MEKEIFISYIVPCYNVEKYLPKCMESLSRQRIDNGAGIEYIFVNDGSTDGCLDLLNTFAAKDERAKVIDKKNQGVSAARNHGLKMATGKYVFFLDGDDFLTDEASQLVYDVYMQKDVDIIIPRAFKVKEGNQNEKVEWKVFPDDKVGIFTVKEYTKFTGCLPASVKVYKRDVLLRNGLGFDERIKVGEVYTFFLHVLAHSEFVALTTMHMFNWLIRDAGTTKGPNVMHDVQIINTLHRIDENASEFPFNIKEMKSYHAGLYNITNIFSIKKYIDYNNQNRKEVLPFLVSVVQDDVYKQSLKYFISEDNFMNSRFVEAIIMRYFPIRLALTLLRLKRIVVHKLNTHVRR